MVTEIYQRVRNNHFSFLRLLLMYESALKPAINLAIRLSFSLLIIDLVLIVEEIVLQRLSRSRDNREYIRILYERRLA